MDSSALIGAASGAAVLVIREAAGWYVAQRKAKTEAMEKRAQADLDKEKVEAEAKLKEEKQRADVSIPINEQAVRVFKDIIDQLRSDMNKLVENMHLQDNLLLQCREEKVTLKATTEMQKQELELGRKRMADLEARMSVQEARPAVTPQPPAGEKK